MKFTWHVFAKWWQTGSMGSFFGGMYAGDPCRARQQVACRQQAHCDTSRRRKKTQLCHIFSYLHCWSYDDCWWFSLLKINHSFRAIIFKTHRNAKCCCTRLWGSTILQFAPKPLLFLIELWLKLNKMMQINCRDKNTVGWVWFPPPASAHHVLPVCCYCSCKRISKKRK